MGYHQPLKAPPPEREEPGVPLLHCHFCVMTETARGGLAKGQQRPSEMYPSTQSQSSGRKWTGAGNLMPMAHGAVEGWAGWRDPEDKASRGFGPGSWLSGDGQALWPLAEAQLQVTGRL